MRTTTHLALLAGTALSLPHLTLSLPSSPNTTLLPRKSGDVPAPPSFIPDYPTAEAGNPFIPNYYATPDIAYHNGTYWVFVAPSPPKERCYQHYFDAYSSPDLLHWTKHDKVLAAATFHRPDAYHWAVCGFTSPHSVFRDGKYYLYFGAGDPEHELSGGLAVGVADAPEGPYRDAVGAALLGRGRGDLRGARVTDPSVLIDDDGQAYLYYGGRAPSYEGIEGPVAVVVKLNGDMVSLGEFRDEHGNAIVFKEVTPSPGGQYGGAVRVFKRRGTYYMLWSEGDPDGEDYRVAYGVAPGPTGPWQSRGVVLEKDGGIATGTGHAAVVNVPGTDVWYVVYSRRQLGEYTGWHVCGDGGQLWLFCRTDVPAYKRVVAYERMSFTEDGRIRPITMRVQDNFEDGSPHGWLEYTSGEYVVEGGKLKGSKGIAAVNTKIYDVVADVDVELTGIEVREGNAGLVVRMRPHPPPAPGEIAAGFAATDGPDDYEGTYAGISAEDGGKVVLGVAAGGQWWPLGEASMPIELGRSYALRVTARQGDVEVFVDDMQTSRVVRRCTDDGSPMALPRQPNCRYWPGGPRPYVRWSNWEEEHIGYAGVRVFAATAAFDNFRVARYEQACATNGNREGCV